MTIWADVALEPSAAGNSVSIEAWRRHGLRHESSSFARFRVGFSREGNGRRRGGARDAFARGGLSSAGRVSSAVQIAKRTPEQVSLRY